MAEVQQRVGSSLGEASASLVEQMKNEISLLDAASQPHAIRLLNDGKLAFHSFYMQTKKHIY